MEKSAYGLPFLGPFHDTDPLSDMADPETNMDDKQT